MIQPQIIGFGAQKSGTTWLFDNLSTNPGVWRPLLKEMHYFNHQESGSRWMFKNHRVKLEMKKLRASQNDNKARVHYFERLLSIPMLTEEWYREAYRLCPADKQSMDITPAYANLNEDSLRYMEKLLGNKIRAIYLIRDPVARVISALKTSASKAPSSSSSVDFWIARAQSNEVQSRSDYISTVRRLDKAFGDRVLYLPFGDIINNPLSLLRSIERHCGLPEGDYPSIGIAKHISPQILPPAGVDGRLQEMLMPQYKWIEERFGPAFADRL